ncbi:MAG TPA: tagaturonate reductase [Syntrophorhabdaceae bacterium]|nr:tagaturonate reductase [Syntrophorhabdaceae bacterium]
MKQLNASLVNSKVQLPKDLNVHEKRNLPERIVQFGEGNFLRGFVDWMVDRMNEQGLFNGGVAVVQPIPTGLAETLNIQNGLYTLYLRGIRDGMIVEEKSIVCSVTRALNPYTDFESYMSIAESPDLRFVISNTTEAGIVYSEKDRPTDRPPHSYPGKLTVLLHRRFEAFVGDPERGLVIIPCELIDRNGDVLKEAVLRLSRQWGYEEAFINWLTTANYFLNSLVDRIVTGYPREEAQGITEELGYEDKLLDTGEVFHLWVIEGDKRFAKELPLSEARLNVIWTDDMTPYRTRKVRILNGAHTMTVLAAYLYGLNTVKECMDDPLVRRFMEKGLYEEIIPTLDMPENELLDFARTVSERFANPFIKHYLLSISLNSTSKFKTRVLPSITEYVARKGAIPEALTFSLAALIAFYRGTEITGHALKGSRSTGGQGTNPYDINDDEDVLELFRDVWKRYEHARMNLNELALAVMSRASIWGFDLNTVPGLTRAAVRYLAGIVDHGIGATLEQVLARGNS